MSRNPNTTRGIQNTEGLLSHPRGADQTIGHRRGRRSLRTIVAVSVVSASAAALVGAGAPAANANPWPWEVPYKQMAFFPTWVFKPTQLCVTNVENTPGMYALVRVTPISRPDLHDDVYAQPGKTTCISRSWGGAPIVANNISATRATVRMATS